MREKLPHAGKTVRIEQSERGLRQTTEGAMGNDILMGLIELITNSDDKYGAQSGSILVRFPKPAADGSWEVQVSDKAGGIDFGDVEEKLLKQGGRTSGHEKGEAKRGNRGRGAKDLCHFGQVRWDIFKGGKYYWLELNRNGIGPMSVKPQRADGMYEVLDFPNGKEGVVATITCDRSRISRPRRDSIRRRLEYAVQLRDIMSNTKRKVKFEYGDDPVVNVHYEPPRRVKVHPEVDVEVKSYPGLAHIVVEEVSEPFQENPDDPSRQGGLLIRSGRAVHEATLNKFESNPYAGYFLGSVRWDTIDDLSRTFDDREDKGLPVDPANNMQIIKADRRGLNYQHPAAQALKIAVESVLGPHFERKAAELNVGGKESVESKRRLAGLARIVAKFQASKAEELEFELTQSSSQGVELTPGVPLLEVIPPRKILEIGKAHTFSVRLRGDALPSTMEEGDAVLAVAAEPEHCVELSGASVTLRPDRRLERRLTGTFTVTGKAEGSAIIEVTVPGLASAIATVELIEPEIVLPPPAPLTFEFERPSYRIAAGKSKRLLLLAPTAAVERHGTAVTISSSDMRGVLVRHGSIELEPSPDGDWYQAAIEAEGRQHGAKARITAHCGSGPLKAETSIEVRRDQSGPVPPKIEFAALQSQVRGQFETDELTGAVTITVNAAHPGVQRYFGPPPEFKRQDTVEARLMIAEIVADLTVLDTLRRQLKQQPLPIDQAYIRRYRMLHELLPLCHASQLGEAELSTDRSKVKQAVKSRVA
jgi:hypothetical protein